MSAELIATPAAPSLGWPRFLTVFAVGLALILALPVVVVLFNLTAPATETWHHLATTVLSDYISNSLLLMSGVALGVIIGGVSTAWLTTMCRFPGSRIFDWALLLPMAMPAYVMAYAYTDLLQFAGPVQTAVREAMAWGPQDYWFPDVRSVGGAMVMFSLVTTN
jgi:iron(III) transport system permease protein